MHKATSKLHVEHTGNLSKGKHQRINVPGLKQAITLAPTVSAITQDYYTDHFLENMNAISQVVSKNNTLKLIELGCGRGLLSLAIKLQFPTIDITLVDKNQHAIDLATKNLKLNGIEHFHTECGCFTHSKYQNQTFDLLISTLPTLPFNIKHANSTDQLCLDGGGDGLGNLRNLGQTFLSYCVSTGKMLFMANDLINITALTEEFKTNGISLNIISKKKKYLSETIYTKSLIDKGMIDHNHLHGDSTNRYFHTLLIEANKQER